MRTIEQVIQTMVVDAAVAVYGVQPSSTVKISVPPDITLGDFAVECFGLAKQFKQDPHAIATELAGHMVDDTFGVFAATGQYINVRLHSNVLFSAACGVNGLVQSGLGKIVMVEYLSPNTNKPLHLGHVRNGVLGMAISNILVSTGNTVVRANLVNDRGVHICKSMLAWMKFANGATPESTGKKGDHFVGDWYVAFANAAKKDPSLEDEAQALLLKWEEGDPDTLALWAKMNSWVYAGFAETYETLGFNFDTFYYESQLYTLGKDIVRQGMEQGLFVQDENGAIVYILDPEKFGKNKDGTLKKKVLIRKDGTSVYTTQDLGVALKKAEDFGLDASTFVVAREQDDHFKVLFDILQALGYPWATQLRHLSYGMVELPNGRMKSREGTVVDADDLVSEVVSLAATEVAAKNADLSEAEVLRRATIIGIGAIKFYLLKSNPKQKIKFDPQESVSFDGVTAPYCQYAYARAVGVTQKALFEGVSIEGASYDVLGNDEERMLAQALLLFGDNLSKAAEFYNPATLATAVYELAKAFHQFYNKHHVLSEDVGLAKARLALVGATSSTIKTGLGLLGVEVLDRM